MAISKDHIKANYPLSVYNYKVSIGGETMAFAEVSGLSMEYETITYKHGLSWKEGATHIPGMSSPINIRMNRGIVKGRAWLYKWLQTISLGTAEKKDIIIDLCDESGAPVISWIVYNAFPKKLDAPTFDSNSNEVAIETLELIGNHVRINFH